MFTEADMRNAKQVVPLNDDDESTQIKITMLEEYIKKRKLVPVAPAVVVLSLALLAIPKGVGLEVSKSVISFLKESRVTQDRLIDTNSGRQESNNIEATNSNVRQIQVTNYGGQVNISSK